MDHHSIPAQEFLPDNVHYQLTEHGGHVGFIGGTLRRPKMWLEARIPDWLTLIWTVQNDYSLAGSGSRNAR
jgi:predicted alpha/beta-fold hydrolase